MWGTSGITIDNLASVANIIRLLYRMAVLALSLLTIQQEVGLQVTIPSTVSITARRARRCGRQNGVAVIANYAIINHEVPYTIASTKGYAITCWSDERNLGSSGSDIYAARFGGATGLLPPLSDCNKC